MKFYFKNRRIAKILKFSDGTFESMEGTMDHYQQLGCGEGCQKWFIGDISFEFDTKKYSLIQPFWGFLTFSKMTGTHKYTSAPISDLSFYFCGISFNVFRICLVLLLTGFAKLVWIYRTSRRKSNKWSISQSKTITKNSVASLKIFNQ